MNRLLAILSLCLLVHAERPNTVVILSDDARFEEFGIYGVTTMQGFGRKKSQK